MSSASHRGASGSDDAPSHVSYNITDPGKIIPGSIDLSDKSISFDPEPTNVWTVPKPKFPPKLIRVHGAELKALLQEPDINKLRNYLTANFTLLETAKQVRKELDRIVKTYAPPDSPLVDDMDPLVLLKWLEDIIQSYQRKLALFDVSLPSLEKSELLEGTTLKLKIDESRKKVSELLKSYQHRLDDAEDNVWHLSEIIQENMQLIRSYEDRIGLLYNQVLALKRRPATGVAEAPEEAGFIKELEAHLDQDTYLNSTFKEELAAEKKTKHSLFQEICRLKELRVLDEQKKMQEIAEIVKDMEMEEGLRKEIVARVKTLTPNSDEVLQAVNNWMMEIKRSINEKEAEIRQAKENYKKLEDKLAEDRLRYQETYQQYNQLIDVMLELDAEINEKLEEFEAKQNELERLNLSIGALDDKSRSEALSPTRYYDATSMLQSPEASRDYGALHSRVGSPEAALRHSTPQSQVYSPEFRGISSSGGLFQSTPKSTMPSPELGSSSGSQSFSFDESPEKPRQGSPYRGVTYIDSGSPMSIHSTPRSTLASYSASPPSPFHMPSPLMQSFGEERAVIPMPGTVEIPSPRFARRTAAIDPSTETRVNNRFDIGKAFNMRTICQTSTPYQQLTRVASLIPDFGYTGEMINYPLSIQHSATLTPTKYETPFISRSRFGYTDPAARVLNIPPDFKTHTPTPFSTSTLSQRQQGISPDIVTYGTPPAVTPTSSRRYGLFTPKGIFRKKHFNIRTLYDPDNYESFELPWSPQYLPKDSRSPISSTSPFSDKSISWAQHSDSPYAENIMDRTFQVSPTINKTFYATALPMDRTFTTSPETLNRTFEVSPQRVLNRTFDASPNVMNQTYDESQIQEMNRTFSIPSPSSSINRTYDVGSPTSMNRTFYTSPHNVVNRTFSASPEVMNRTYNTSPTYAMDKTFNKSLSSPLGRSFQRSPSPARHVTFAPDRTFNVDQPYDMNTTF